MAIRSSSKKTLIFNAPDAETFVMDVLCGSEGGVDVCVMEEGWRWTGCMGSAEGVR